MENEIKTVVILAAGRSRRMENLSKKFPKCLLEYQNELILSRLIRQIKESGVKNIVIVVGYRADYMHSLYDADEAITLVDNKYYEEDVNIYSLSLALTKVYGPFVLFEADTVMEDALVRYVVGSDFEKKSVWFTRGRFKETQYGGILRSDKYGVVKDIRLISAWSMRYKSYSKLSGIMRIGPNEFELFKALVNKYSKTTIKQYFLNAWIENLRLLPCIEADISGFQFFTFNKPDEYYQMSNSVIGIQEEAPNIEYVEVNSLKHIEDYDRDRVLQLKEKILSEKTWTVPIIVDKLGLVLDGEHRMEVAKSLGLKRVPAICVDYNSIVVWSLRKEYKVSPKLVERKVKRGEIYPYKTVKHKFNFLIPNTNINIEDLK